MILWRTFPPIFLWLILGFNAAAMNIAVQDGNWGDVRTDEINKVLESTAMVFLPHIPALKDTPISVYKNSLSPKIYYLRSKDGSYRINISAKDRFWCQYAFQFAHELAHLICRTKKGDFSNQWFEECLCEAASLFALLELSKFWSQKPPYANWKHYAIEFKKYRIDRIRNSSYPENFQLSYWWENNKLVLSQKSYLRKQNIWVAIKMLQIIEENPGDSWSACQWLNHHKTEKKKSFEQYLKDWKFACPESNQKKFVQKIMVLFGLTS